MGKRSIGVAVRRAQSLDRLGYKRSFARSFVTLAFWIMSPIWVLDYLWPIWDQQRQALHDKVVARVVIRSAAS